MDLPGAAMNVQDNRTYQRWSAALGQRDAQLPLLARKKHAKPGGRGQRGGRRRAEEDGQRVSGFGGHLQAAKPGVTGLF